MCSTFQPFRRQPPLTPWHRFHTLPLSLPGLQDLLVPVWASPSVGRLAAFQAESRSSSCGLVVRLPLLLTPPCGDAITVDYRPESACRKWTSTTPIEHTYGRTGSCLRSKQREPLALHPLWFPDAGPRLSRQQRASAARGQSSPIPSRSGDSFSISSRPARPHRDSTLLLWVDSPPSRSHARQILVSAQV